MANEPARLPPFEALRNELNGLRHSVALKLAGKSHIVDMLDAYLVATENRLQELEHGKAKK